MNNYIQWNLSNPTHQWIMEGVGLYSTVSRTCLIRHRGLGKCVGLYRMSEYSGFTFS